MVTVSEVVEAKGSDVRTVYASDSVLDAARVMNRHKIGAVVVLDGSEVVGILTERDVMTRVVAEARAPAHTSVSHVMTTPVLTCGPGTKLTEARAVMRDKRIRHLPVAEGGRLVGMISIGDLNMADHQTLEETIRHMESYIAGGPL